MRLDFDFTKSHEEEGLPRCERQGCENSGQYRAPKSRDIETRQYYLFCLEHVQEYNRAWDYYADMPESEIERSRRDDVTWNRPTWKLSGKGGQEARVREEILAYIFGEHRQPYYRPHAPRYPRAVEKALQVLELATLPVSIDGLKRHYHMLARTYHPDAHNGSRENEERFKEISVAYGQIRKYLEELDGL